MAHNAEIKPLHAIVVIAIALVLIYLYIWANGKWLEVGGPNQMRLDAEGNLYIHIAERLFRLDKNEASVKQYRLSDYGVYDMVGDFDFFANGDILLRKGHYDPGLVEGVQMYRRVIDQSDPRPTNPDEGLFRCQLDSRICSRFGQLDFNAAFHVLVDREYGDVYVSDTNRSAVRKYNSEGVEQSVDIDSFWFPNHSMLWNGYLLVADTNHHLIKALFTQNDDALKLFKAYPVAPAQFGSKNWVFSFARVADTWWVNNMGMDMVYGLVGIFDDDFHFKKMVNLPQDADPNDMLVFKQLVYITDLANNRIYQLDLDGNLQNSNLPESIRDYLADLDSQRMIYKAIKYLAVALFVIFFLSGVWIGLRQSGKF